MTVATRSTAAGATTSTMRSPKSATNPHQQTATMQQTRKQAATTTQKNATTTCDECLCTICTCGQHACPPTAHSTHFPSDMKSTSHAGYTGLQPTRTYGTNSQSLVLDHNNRNKSDDRKFNAQTNYQSEYTSKNSNIIRAKGMQQAPSLEKHTPFIGESTKQHDYTAKPLLHQERIRKGAHDKVS
jgi:hypothetical protein